MSNGIGAVPANGRRNADVVRMPKTAERVAQQIRNAIIRGNLTDGDTLPAESQLIAEFEVSRPTIREAVRILESEGLVAVARGARGGARISSPDFAMIQRAAGITLQSQGVTIGDVYEMHTLLEPPAARLVAERCSARAAPVLREIVEREFSLAHDVVAATPVIAEFHRNLIAFAGNKTLIVFVQALQGLAEAHVALAQRRNPKLDPAASVRQQRQGFKSHARLVDLIEAGDGPGAEAHWREHMIAAGKVWMANIGSDSIVDLID